MLGCIQPMSSRPFRGSPTTRTSKETKMIMSNTIRLGVLACVFGVTMHAGNVDAQQVLIPQTAAEVHGPLPGPMTKEYVRTVGRMAYLWGWPLVAVSNQSAMLTK